jgi:pilus assembly protein CpaF
MNKMTVHANFSMEDDVQEAVKENIAEEYFQLKTTIHTRLLDMIDLSLLDTMEHDVLRNQIGMMVEKILLMDESSIPLNSIEKRLLVGEIQDEVLGLGPLEPFLQDPSISDILVNNYKKIYIERFGICVVSSIKLYR